MIIESVEVEGFWGNQKALAKFNQDVTIFIGFNGTGKSTFLNLIAAALSFDFLQLSSIQFESIKIKLVDRKTKKQKTIQLSKQIYENNIGIYVYNYKISNKTYNNILIDNRLMLRSRERLLERSQYRIPAHIREEQINLKKELSSLVEVSQISVYRHAYDESLEYDPRQRVSAVDERLKQLFEKFARYQLKLETRLNEISKKFQQATVSSLLYNDQFDQPKHNKTTLNKIDLKSLRGKLELAFRELGIQGKNQDIENHIQKLDDALLALKDDKLEAKFLLVLPLIYRTNHIIDSLKQSEEEKNQITEARRFFFETLHKFMSNKTFDYDNKTGDLSFFIDQKSDSKLSWITLSSGEKQLLIQFLEVLLQENRSVIFIADEPEISLHVTWQENLLKALGDLNKNAQLIIATHSPDIVADFRDKVIDMQKVVF